MDLATPPLREQKAPGAFRRGEYVFRDRVTADGSSGFPAEPGRYHLYVSAACPWAQRSMIVRRRRGLEEVVGMSVVDPVRDDRGWAFTEPDHRDPVNGFSFLAEAYLATDPGFDGPPTVPVLWDTHEGRIVSNDFPEIAPMLDREFEEWASGAPLYPDGLWEAIWELDEVLYHNVNDGVYRCGFAGTQEAYEEAFDVLFRTLGELDEVLGGRRYLLGERPSGADVHLYTTLARFDAVYHVHFKANLRRLVDHPNLWPYARDLYQGPGFGETTDLDQIKRHYYLTHPGLNPSRIIPRGPEMDWAAPHGREELGAG